MFSFFNIRKRLPDNLSVFFGDPKNERFNFEQIARYFWKKDKADTFQRLSNKTCADLDFEELFMFVDRTCSRAGQQFLYDKLRTIPHDGMENGAHEKVIDEFLANRGFLNEVQIELSRLNKPEAFYIRSLFQDEHLKPPRWFSVAPWLSVASIILLIGAYFNPILFFGWLLIVVVNVCIHFWNKSNLNQYLSSLPQLLVLSKTAKELFRMSVLKSINPHLNEALNELNKVRSRLAFFQFESSVQGDLGVLAWVPLELIKMVTLFEPQLLFHVLNRLDSKRNEIESVFQFVGQIDTLASIAVLRSGVPTFCIPDIHDFSKGLEATNVYHPLIPDCIRNTIVLDGKSILLTGSNMSGKTSFIRTIAVNVVTALTLNTCFADHFSLCRMRIHSAIRISDDLLNDRSYYFEEVLTIKEMISASESEYVNLFLLDEIFKGTNTIERIAAGKSVLSYLNRKNNIVFVSTHDVELADFLNDEYELYHFSELVNHQTVDFDYKLKPGKLTHRNAIRILQINDYPPEIIAEAMELAKDLDALKKTN